jgi:hypothetical protein
MSDLRASRAANNRCTEKKIIALCALGAVYITSVRPRKERDNPNELIDLRSGKNADVQVVEPH